MDLSKVTDVKELKALGFDILKDIEFRQDYLRKINLRLAQLENGKEKEKKDEPKAD